MMNFFDVLIEYINLAWSFFLNTVNSITTAFGLLRQTLLHIFDIIGFYPTILSSCAVIVIAIIVVRFAIGR